MLIWSIKVIRPFQVLLVGAMILMGILSASDLIPVLPCIGVGVVFVVVLEFIYRRLSAYEFNMVYNLGNGMVEMTREHYDELTRNKNNY